MAVFPERMNKLDVNDTAGSLRRIENYIGYMTERMEFSNRNMTRNVSDAGLSNVEILSLVQDMAGAVSILSSTVNGMVGTVTQMSNRLTDLQAQVDALKISEARLSAVEDTAAENRDTIAALLERVSDLEDRMGE